MMENNKNLGTKCNKHMLVRIDMRLQPLQPLCVHISETSMQCGVTVRFHRVVSPKNSNTRTHTQKGVVLCPCVCSRSEDAKTVMTRALEQPNMSETCATLYTKNRSRTLCVSAEISARNTHTMGYIYSLECRNPIIIANAHRCMCLCVRQHR